MSAVKMLLQISSGNVLFVETMELSRIGMDVYGNGKNFCNLVNRYKLAERTRGYLIAKGLESIEESDNDVTD